MKELKRHGYRVSPGTLYPLLHVLQRNRLDRAKKKGQEALNFAKDKVREVFGGPNRGTVVWLTAGPQALRQETRSPATFAITILLVSARGLTGQRGPSTTRDIVQPMPLNP